MHYGERVVTMRMAGEDLGEENYKAGLGIPSCLYAKNKLAFYMTSAFQYSVA